MQEPEPAPMGAFSRVAGVFFEPAKTFEDIGRKPSWLLPVLLLILATVGVVAVMGQRIGWDTIARQRLEATPQYSQMTTEQKDQAVAMGARMSRFAYVFPAFLPVGYLVLAGIFMAFTAMMSAGLRFKQVYAVVCHANLPGILSAILTIVVMFLKEPDKINIQNPLAFNPAAFMDPDSASKFVYSLASSLDLFSFWIIFLLATGFKAAAGRKLSFAGALTAVVVPWALYVLAKSALAR